MNYAAPELVTVRALTTAEVNEQRERQQLDQQAVGYDVLIRQPYNFVGVPMSILQKTGDVVECYVHDINVRLRVMAGKTRAEIPAKFLIPYKKGAT